MIIYNNFFLNLFIICYSYGCLFIELCKRDNLVYYLKYHYELFVPFVFLLSINLAFLLFGIALNKSKKNKLLKVLSILYFIFVFITLFVCEIVFNSFLNLINTLY